MFDPSLDRKLIKEKEDRLINLMFQHNVPVFPHVIPKVTDWVVVTPGGKGPLWQDPKKHCRVVVAPLTV